MCILTNIEKADIIKMVFPDKTAVSKKQGGAWGNAVMYTAGETSYVKKTYCTFLTWIPDLKSAITYGFHGVTA